MGQWPKDLQTPWEERQEALKALEVQEYAKYGKTIFEIRIENALATMIGGPTPRTAVIEGTIHSVLDQLKRERYHDMTWVLEWRIIPSPFRNGLNHLVITIRKRPWDYELLSLGIDIS